MLPKTLPEAFNPRAFCRPAAVGKEIINFFYMRHVFLVFVYTLCIVYNKAIGEMASFATSLI